MELTAYLSSLEHPVLSQRHCLLCHSNSPFLWFIRKDLGVYLAANPDPEGDFQIQLKLPFCSDPLSPCCTQAGEQSCAIAHSVPWVAFLHGGTWSSWRIVLWWAEIPPISLASWRVGGIIKNMVPQKSDPMKKPLLSPHKLWINCSGSEIADSTSGSPSKGSKKGKGVGDSTKAVGLKIIGKGKILPAPYRIKSVPSNYVFCAALNLSAP